MSKDILSIYCCCIFICFVGCSRNVSDEELSEVEHSIAEFQYLEMDSDYIFDQDEFHTFEIILPEENLAFLDADPAAEQYVEGALKFEGETLSSVGVRYKGSIGSFWGCLSGDPNNGPSGYKTCHKLPMKVKVNWQDSDLKFYGLKKLQFHSLNKDPSQMKERLSYHLYNVAGVAAPRCVHVRLLINGELSGVYALVEQIDGRFSDYHFKEGDGNVYREVWPLDDKGMAWPKEKYQDALRTNEEENDVSLIRDFALELQEAKDEELQSIINKWMIPKEALTFCVIDRVLKHDDGPFHWYCNTNSCAPHNFYLYEDPKNQKIHFVPWDLDAVLKNYLVEYSATEIADEWGEISNNCEPYDVNGLLQRSAACDKLIAGLAKFELEYEQIKQEFINVYFSKAEIDFLLEKWSFQIEATTEESNQLYGSESISTLEWQNSLMELQEALSLARNN